MLLLVAAIAALWLAPARNKFVIGAAMAACGFLVYGPLMLVSVAAAGYVSPNLAGSASGLAGLFGYIGATLSGAGLGATAEHAGWPAVFGILVAASLLSAGCFAFTMRAPAPQNYEHETIQSSTT
jgi:sugar phosphate permease